MGTIAIIGTGISGLGAAYLLNPMHDITVYEKAAVVGGHARTRRIRYNDREIAVDTGFIVFNRQNYPNLTKLFAYLNVPIQKSTMSFAVTANNGALEWGAETLGSVFGQRRNLVRPAFYRFLFDVLKFNRSARDAVARYPDFTMRQLLEYMRLGDWFARYYILPMGGSIWSCSLQSILSFPAKMFVDFFHAHGLLTVTQQPQWYTVDGGSQVYIDLLTESFKPHIQTSCAAVSVKRSGGKVVVHDSIGDMRAYDHVVLAGHADEMLALLSDEDRAPRQVLEAFTYQKNVAVLHKDASIMPKRRRCWASWVYHDEGTNDDEPIAITYWMNHLQNIDEDHPLFVSLNPRKPIRTEDEYDTHEFMHPVYTPQAAAAQQEIQTIQGHDGIWFCGAYQRNGFHEDGLTSAVAVAEKLGAQIPWR